MLCVAVHTWPKPVVRNKNTYPHKIKQEYAVSSSHYSPIQLFTITKHDLHFVAVHNFYIINLQVVSNLSINTESW